MAIKQHTTEIQDSNIKTTFETLLSDLERISEDFLQENADKNWLITVSEQIVNSLANVHPARDPDSIKSVQLDVVKIHKFFEALIETKHENTELVARTCMTSLYRLITAADCEPSYLASSVLKVVEDKYIRQACLWILSQLDNTSDEGIRRAFKRLCIWLRGLNCAPLHLWILEILEVLREQQRYDILLELASDNITELFISLIIPVIRPRSKPIVFLMLASVRHTPKIFHEILPRAKNLLNYFSNEIKDGNPKREENLEFFQDLLGLIAQLVELFPGYDDKYSEITEYLMKYHNTTSMNIVKLFRAPPWCAEDANRQKQLILSPMLSNKNVRTGLVNLGNTCYLNSILQSLMMTKQFSREILNTNRKTDFFKTMQLLIGLLIHTERPCVNPEPFVTTIKPPDFLPGYQQDSSEFLGFILDKLHEEEKNFITKELSRSVGESSGVNDIVIELQTPAPISNCDDQENANNLEENWDEFSETENSVGLKKFATVEDLSTDGSNDVSENLVESSGQEIAVKAENKIIDNTSKLTHQTLIQKVFEGKVSTIYQCFACQSKSINIDSFRDLQLGFPEQQQPVESNASKYASASKYSVQSLLDYYCSSEKLDGENQYFCDNCKSLSDGLRSIHIVEPPKNLILTLKHFRYEKRYHTRQKLLHNVDHDENILVEVRPNLDLPENSKKSVKYSLYAAVIHSGMSMDSGHYYTFAASNDEPGVWYKFNDSFVSKATLNELNHMTPPNTPYILFYRMMPSKSSEATSTIQSSAAVPTKKISSPSKLSTNEEDGTIMKKQCLSGKDDHTSALAIKDDINDLPDFSELPLQIQDYIRKDNNAYQSVQRQLLNKDRYFHMKINKPSNSNDSDDEPPSTCGGNDLYSYNRFIY